MFLVRYRLGNDLIPFISAWITLSLAFQGGDWLIFTVIKNVCAKHNIPQWNMNTYKILANITFGVVHVLVARFMERMIIRHGKLKQNPRRSQFTRLLVLSSNIKEASTKSESETSIFWTVQHLIIRYCLVASMTTETFWMPNSSHATQVSSMANFTTATSTDSTQEE